MMRKSIEQSPRRYEDVRFVVQRVPGALTTAQQEYLFNKLLSLPDNARILEIGSYKGRSTVTMGLAALDSNRKLFCIDLWQDDFEPAGQEDLFEIWRRNIQDAGVESLITPLQGFSHEVLAAWHERAGDTRIDFAMLDGSKTYEDVLADFQLVWPLVNDNGWIAIQDVHHTRPGPRRVWFEVAKQSLIDHEYVGSLACGRKNPGATLLPRSEHREEFVDARLPIHFFTNVLNGMPYIRHHVAQMKNLKFKWHWHIVEGVAELKHDTAWSVARGGNVPKFAHIDGRSSDGTTQYLDQLQRELPQHVTVYRKPLGVHWNGKVEMVNQPVMTIAEESLLWEIDVDELWTTDHFNSARQLFLDHPSKTAAYYWCWCFVGPRLLISTRNCYANNPKMEWLRTWRFRPGMHWLAHEPPLLAETRSEGRFRDVAEIDPMLHDQTEAVGLVFQHYAYATREQVRFKQDYYGYPGAVERWEALQTVESFPVSLRDYFPWVRDHAQVDRAARHITDRLIELPDPVLPTRVYPQYPRSRAPASPIVDGLLERALFQQHSGNIAEAEALCREALEREPHHLRLLNLLAYLCQQSGQTNNAVDLFNRMIALEPNVPAFHNNLAAILGSLGKFNECVEILQRGIEMRPDYTAFYINLGITLSKLERFEEAANVYRRALLMGHDDSLVRTNLKSCLRKIKEG